MTAELEVARLREHEAAIERSLSELGWHLRAIRDERLYRETHETFEDYCRSRWGYGRHYVNRQIAAAETIDALPMVPNGTIPTEGQVRPLSALPLPERAEAWAEAVERTAGNPSARDVAEVVKERRTPQAVPKPSLPGVPPHPATYPSAVLDIFRDVLDGRRRVVLDPFAGVGTIHQLRPEHDTLGVELEPEWASAHSATICGDARNVAALLDGRQVDAVATSPAYGNRLADSYEAYDPQARRSYAIDLGRSLSAGSGAALQYGPEYEALHRDAWRACVELLMPGGLFLLNCKDHVREGAVVPVTGWHVGALAALGLVAIDLRCLPAAGLAMTTAGKLSELVVIFRKGDR
jgi:hypothetical protein